MQELGLGPQVLFLTPNYWHYNFIVVV